MKNFDKYLLEKKELNSIYGGRKVSTSYQDDCGGCFTDEMKYIFGVLVKTKTYPC